MRKGYWNSEEGQLRLAGKLSCKGRFVEEVALKLSSQLCVQKGDELSGKP